MAILFERKTLSEKYDYLAPDTSEIRLLAQAKGGGLAHCTLPALTTSLPVKHKTVNEIWYCLSGAGAIWQMKDADQEVYPFSAGQSFTIPVGNHFQFKNTGTDVLHILIVTIPEWPAMEEAEPVKGYW